ncbi:hypothetical protein QOT17_019004 [Balamuthia mandrillaris]
MNVGVNPSPPFYGGTRPCKSYECRGNTQPRQSEGCARLLWVKLSVWVAPSTPPTIPYEKSQKTPSHKTANLESPASNSLKINTYANTNTNISPNTQANKRTKTKTNKTNHAKPFILTCKPVKKPSPTTPPNTLIANRYQNATQNQPTSYPIQCINVHKYPSRQNCFSLPTISTAIAIGINATIQFNSDTLCLPILITPLIATHQHQIPLLLHSLPKTLVVHTTINTSLSLLIIFFPRRSFTFFPHNNYLVPNMENPHKRKPNEEEEEDEDEYSHKRKRSEDYDEEGNANRLPDSAANELLALLGNSWTLEDEDFDAALHRIEQLQTRKTDQPHSKYTNLKVQALREIRELMHPHSNRSLHNDASDDEDDDDEEDLVPVCVLRGFTGSYADLTNCCPPMEDYSFTSASISILAFSKSKDAEEARNTLPQLFTCTILDIQYLRKRECDAEPQHVLYLRELKHTAAEIEEAANKHAIVHGTYLYPSNDLRIALLRAEDKEKLLADQYLQVGDTRYRLWEGQAQGGPKLWIGNIKNLSQKKSLRLSTTVTSTPRN